jgi:hypothetical protein
VPLDALSDETRALAGRIDLPQAESLIGRLSAGLMKRIGGDAAAARDLINTDQPEWDSADGRRICTLMDALNVPANWREPDFVTLRDAYALHARRRRRPDAPLLPGDSDAMSAVPDALAYAAIYAGKS